MGCSTLVCESEHDGDKISAGLDKVTIDGNKSDDCSPIAVGSSCSDTTASCCGLDQQASTLSTIDGTVASSSNTNRSSTLISGHTSPSSLALRRKLPNATHLYSQNTDSNSTANECSNLISSISANSHVLQNNNNNNNSNTSNNNRTRLNNTTGSVPKNKTNDIIPTPLQLRPTCTQSNIAISEQFCFDPPPLRSKAWSESSAESYQIRSKGYMNNKFKELSAPSAFTLLSVDLVNSHEPMYGGMCAHPEERVQKALQRERETNIRELPEFVFAVNLCVPADTTTTYHAVFYFGADTQCMDEIKCGRTPFGRIMNQFLFGDSDSYRNQTFKLIPRIVEGNYVVRKAVGSRPAILGSKIKQYYVKSDRFFEVIVDISSDSVAKRITKLCLGCIKTIVVDMMFALEGYDESTLPERIFGGVRLQNLDFKTMDGKRTVNF